MHNQQPILLQTALPMLLQPTQMEHLPRRELQPTLRDQQPERRRQRMALSQQMANLPTLQNLPMARKLLPIATAKNRPARRKKGLKRSSPGSRVLAVQLHAG